MKLIGQKEKKKKSQTGVVVKIYIMLSVQDVQRKCQVSSLGKYMAFRYFLKELTFRLVSGIGQYCYQQLASN